MTRELITEVCVHGSGTNPLYRQSIMCENAILARSEEIEEEEISRMANAPYLLAVNCGALPSLPDVF